MSDWASPQTLWLCMQLQHCLWTTNDIFPQHLPRSSTKGKPKAEVFSVHRHTDAWTHRRTDTQTHRRTDAQTHRRRHSLSRSSEGGCTQSEAIRARRTGASRVERPMTGTQCSNTFTSDENNPSPKPSNTYNFHTSLYRCFVFLTTYAC